jgi:hypothetical protein
MKTSNLLWVALGGAALLLLGGSKGAASTGKVTIKSASGGGAPPGGSGAGPVASTPPVPVVGAVSSPVYASPSTPPSDLAAPAAIANCARMTIRQIQTAFNSLGAAPALAVSGVWDVPTQQAVWDWQYVHQNDNPSAPLNVTGEVDQLTQNSIQAAYGKAKGITTGFY